MKKIFLALALSLSLVLGMLAMPGCGAYDPDKQLYFCANEDGTCYVSGVFSTSMTEQHVPAVTKDGAVVVGIDGDAFARCSELAVVTFPDTLLWIGDDVFWGTEYYHNADNWLDGVLYVEQYAISAKNVKSVTVREGTRLLADHFGASREAIEEVILPESLVYVGFLPFKGCNALTKISVAAGNDVYYSEGNCLVERATQTVVFGTSNAVLPDDGSILAIGQNAFYGREALGSIVIPDGVTRIESSAFADCTGLTTVTIPASVTELGWFAFSGCKSLTRIEFGGTTEEWAAIQKDSNEQWKSGTALFTVYCTNGTVPKNEA